MRKIVFMIGGIILVLLIGLVLLRGVGGEDDWICVGEGWVRHGNPSMPPPTTPCGEPVALPGEAIVVSEPVLNQPVVNPLRLVGKARTFEYYVEYRVRDEDGKVLSEGNFIANGGPQEAPDFYSGFNQSINYNNPKGKTGTLEVFESSAKDGTEVNKITIPLLFVKEVTVVKIFLGNKKFNPNAEDCSKVYPVDRVVEKTPAIARSALTELMFDGTENELGEGYYSGVRGDAKIQKLAIEDGVAKVDFSKELEDGVGGSCMTAFIRAQITETLKQFSTVKDVVISINGQTEEILQP